MWRRALFRRSIVAYRWEVVACLGPARSRALLVEPQAFFAPYFAERLEAAGFAIVETIDRADRAAERP